MDRTRTAFDAQELLAKIQELWQRELALRIAVSRGMRRFLAREGRRSVRELEISQ